ncbi:repressor protein [Burkholderia cepacia]|nr:repressor protein [Burkholderia cepacia]KVV62671.1 repressor protein [Burkholderia cepacia]KVV68354.1 repressor protein [Burkholderia cepacia]KVV75526.1 repressor protein [Burkholderia cepacia]KVV79368.1 repressor protein [Burkholderia cepacia]
MFFARLRQAIGTDDLYGWGKAHGFPRQTLYNMVSGQKIPGLETLRKFRDETGKPIGWLLGEDVTHPTVTSLNHDDSPTNVQDTRNVNGLSGEFVYIPRYPRNGSPEQVTMAFRRYWVEKYLQANPEELIVLRVDDDVMEGTFNRADNILVNCNPQGQVKDGLYALYINEAMVVRRVQVLPNNVIRVMPDNPRYPSFETSLEEGSGVEIAGVPVWYSRTI